MNDKKISLWKIVIEAVIAGALVFFLTVTNIISPIDHILQDKLYQRPRGVESDIKIIAIDEKTLDKLGPISGWSRSVYADLIDVLNTNDTQKPYVIAFDILFSGNVDEGDILFAQKAKESGNVVVVSQLLYKEKPEYKNGIKYYPVDAIAVPYSELEAVTLQGYSNVAQDSDGKVRRILPQEVFNGKTFSIFSKVIYEEYCRQSGIEQTNTIPIDKYNRSLINYSGKPGDYEAVSLIDVLEGKIDPRAFSESIIIVGAYAMGMQDNFNVPNGNSNQMYGVEIHANLVQSFMENRFSVSANPYLTGIITGLLATVIHIIFRRKKLWISAIVLVVFVFAECFAGVKLNDKGHAMHLLYFILVLVVSYVYSIVMGYFFEKHKRKKVLNAFKKYVAPEIVNEIASKGDFSIKLGGENKDIAVLFVDIRGFTTMSEALEPETVVEILNRYLNLTTNAIFKNKGTLDKFVGDATMAVFNSPFDLDDYEFRAVCAAVDIVEGGETLEKELFEQYGRSVGFGVGVNVGPAVVGNVGCEFRMDYTAIGDTVNTAARLEANAKKGQVLISDALYERVKDRVEVEEVGEIPLKGKSKGVFVYSVRKVKR